MEILMNEMGAVRQLTLAAVIIRTVTAIVLGGILGMERGLKNRPAGLRTYMLVCLGACLVMITNQYIYQVLGSGDPVRMGAQVISGIGFLGAGTIMVTPHSQIKGLTTAAGLWASACVGLAIGIGFYEVAIVGAVGIFVILTVVQILDDYMHTRSRTVEAYVELENDVSIGDFIAYARKYDIEPQDIQLEHKFTTLTNRTSFVVVLNMPRRAKPKELLEILQALEGIVCVQPL